VARSRHSRGAELTHFIIFTAAAAASLRMQSPGFNVPRVSISIDGGFFAVAGFGAQAYGWITRPIGYYDIVKQLEYLLDTAVNECPPSRVSHYMQATQDIEPSAHDNLAIGTLGGMGAVALAATGVGAPVAAGYLQGFPDASFRPMDLTTRAQAAQVLAEVLAHLAPQ